MQIAGSVLGTTREEILDRAARHYFSCGLNDGASSLCKENFKYGIAKIHMAQEHLGMTPDAFFLSTPDETISRNAGRWNAGFGYGGKLTWGDGSDKVVFIGTKPNYCGILVGGLNTIPEPKELIARINDFLKEEIFIDDFQIQSDFAKSNHFIDLFKVEPFTEEEKHAIGQTDAKIPGYIFMIHGSCPELRAENPKGVGLYYNDSKTLDAMATKLQTPFGPVRYIVDADARDYMAFCRYADDFSKRKRRKVASLLFGSYKEISNTTHQGLANMNSILLGAQDTMDPDASMNLFPIALRGDLPAYLMEGMPNLTAEIIEAMGFTKRAEALGLGSRLRNANIMPHGGGYKFDDIASVTQVLHIKGRRYFVCEMENDVGIKIVEEVSALEFSYRGKTVVKKTVDVGMGRPVFKLVPKYVLKI